MAKSYLDAKPNTGGIAPRRTLSWENVVLSMTL